MSPPLPQADQAAPGVEVVLLTIDDEFRDTVMTAAGEQRPVFPVHTLSEALELVGDRQPGVLITDTESLGPNPRLTLDRLQSAALDLVVVLAGDRAGGSDLMELVERGEIFRAILRPASLGQTGLCIQAAAERHIELLMGKEPPTASPTEPAAPPVFKERRRSSLAAPVVGLAVAAITYVLMPKQLLNNDTSPVAPAATPGTTVTGSTTVPMAADQAGSPASGLITRQPEPLDPAVESLVVQGDEALAAGQLNQPESNSAVASYLAAFELAPDSERVQEGLGRVADALSAAAAEALMEGHSADAARYIDDALKLRPESPQLAYLSGQIRQEQGRAFLTQAREAAEANDWQGTATYLEAAGERLDGDIRVPSYAATDPFLARAEAAMAEGKVARSEGIIRQVSKVVPDHPRIAPLERAIADQKAQHAAAARRTALAASKQTAAAEAAAAAEAQLQALIVAADASFEDGRLVGEGADNALAQLREARAVAPEDPKVLSGFDRLSLALLARADVALESGEYETAERWIAEAGVLGIAPERVAAARDRVGLARRAEVSNTVIPASEMKRVAYVPPEYPGRAWRLGVEGWVDVEFDVTRQGDTTALMVVATERRGYFEDAVLEAVSKWQYEPRVFGGEPIDQRVTVRINFERTME